MLPPPEGGGQSLGLDPEQQTLAVVVQDLGVLGQEGPGGAADGEDLGQDVGPGPTDRIRVDAARRGPIRHGRPCFNGSRLGGRRHIDGVLGAG